MDYLELGLRTAFVVGFASGSGVMVLCWGMRQVIWLIWGIILDSVEDDGR